MDGGSFARHAKNIKIASRVSASSGWVGEGWVGDSNSEDYKRLWSEEDAAQRDKCLRMLKEGNPKQNWGEPPVREPSCVAMLCLPREQVI